MTTRQIPRRSPGNEAGVALVWALMLSLVGLLLTGALSMVLLSGMKATSTARSSEVAHALAEAGVNATIFQIEAATNPGSGAIGIETYLTTALGAANPGTRRAGARQFTGTLTGGSYAATLSDPSAGDNVFTLTSVGRDQVSGRTRTMVAFVRQQPVAALSYALFGNQVHFDNHNKVTYGLTLNTTVYSNASVLIDRGVRINGLVQAVSTVEPNTGPASGTASVPNTILSPPGQQGDPDPMTSDPDGPVVQVVPAPPILPFPTFDFYAAQAAAAASGRSLTSGQLNALTVAAQAYANGRPSDGQAYALPQSSYPAGLSATNIPINVIHYKTSSANPHPRDIAVPNASNPDAFVPLGSSNGTSNPAGGTHLYEIQFVGNPLSDTLLYVQASLNLAGPTTTLLQFQGSIIVNGAVQINAPTEILAWDNRTGPNFVALGQSLYTDSNGNSTVATTLAGAAPGQPYDIIYSDWPAIAANGAIKVAASGSNQGGPVHIEGTVYSVAESHFHKSDPKESSYAVGSEIADTVHNCQWFSFAYDPRAKFTRGLFGKVSGRAQLQVIRLEDYSF